jgi:hypothetical protein
LALVVKNREEIGGSGGFGTAVLHNLTMIPTSKLQRFLVLLSVSSGWLLLMSTAARANSWPPMAVGLFYLPFAASVISFGVGFLLIVWLEAWILVRRENLQLWHSVRLVTEANLLSTLAGIGVVLTLAGLPYELNFQYMGNFSWLFWLIVATVCLGLGVCTAGSLKHLSKFWSGHFLIWSIVWAIILFAELTLIGLVNSTHNWVLQLLATAIYYSVGLVLSIVVESFWLSRRLSEKTATLGQTMLIANVRSYAYIAIPITIFLLFLKK